MFIDEDYDERGGITYGTTIRPVVNDFLDVKIIYGTKSDRCDSYHVRMVQIFQKLYSKHLIKKSISILFFPTQNERSSSKRRNRHV